MSAFPLDRPCENSFVETSRETFHRAGLKATHARLEVARYLAQAPRLVTISEVIREVGSDQMDRTTVLRILRVFAEVGFVVVHRIQGRELQFEVQRSLLGPEKT